MLRALWLIALLLVGGCSSESYVFVPYPDIPDGVNSMLLAYFQASDEATEPRVFAFNVPVSGKIELPFESENAIFEAALYFRDLDELAIEPGELELNPRGEPIEPPDYSLTSSLIEGAFGGGWVELDAYSQAMADLRIGPGSPCIPFEIEEIIIDREGAYGLRFAQRLPDGRVLMADEGIISVFDESYPVEDDKRYTVKLATDPPDLGRMVKSGFVTHGGEVFLGGKSGQIWRGELVGERLDTTLVATSSPAVQVLWLDGRKDDVETEVFGFLQTGDFFRFDGSEMTVLDRLAVEDLEAPDSDEHAIYIGPGEAIAVSRYQSSVVRYRNGNTFTEPITFAPFPSVAVGANTAAQVGDLTLIGGVGFIGYYDNGSWRQFGTEMLPEVHGIVPFRDGFFMLSAGGFREFNPELGGFCPRFDLPLSEEIRVGAPLGSSGAFLLGGDQTGARPEGNAFVLTDPFFDN